ITQVVLGEVGGEASVLAPRAPLPTQWLALGRKKARAMEQRTQGLPKPRLEWRVRGAKNPIRPSAEPGLARGQGKLSLPQVGQGVCLAVAQGGAVTWTQFFGAWGVR
ncbi:unnamed protein product, partial [Discosporangium mesarthrocarpum]